MVASTNLVCGTLVAIFGLPAIAAPTSAAAGEPVQSAGASQCAAHEAAVPCSDRPSAPETKPLDPVVVLGERRSEASSILRSGVDPMKVPWSVQVIPLWMLEEKKPEAIEDALSLVPNVAFQGDSDGRENAFVIRGFQAGAVLRDGFRVETFGGVADPEIYNLQSLEVLKGPQAVLFGDSNPGGLINMRAKRPLDHDHGEVVLDYGTDGLVSPKTDFGGSIAGSDTARYRVIGLYKSDQGWRGYTDPNERWFFAPSAQLAITENTGLTLIGEFTQDDYQADFGTAINLQGELTAPIKQVNNNPQDRIRRHQYTVGADLVQRLSDNWYVTARARRFDGGYEFSSLWLPISLNLATNIYTQLALQQEQQNDEWALQLSVAGKADLLERPTEFVAGSDFRQSRTVRTSRLDGTSLNFLNWAHPDYSRLPPAKEQLPLFAGLFAAEDISRVGVYADIVSELTPTLSLSLGARYDHMERTPRAGSTTTAQDLSKPSLQAGLTYVLSDMGSVYASYSESFSPNFSLDKNNHVLPPEEGKGFDIGFKSADLWGVLAVTVGLFDITKHNVALPDPSATRTDPNPLGFIASAEQTSRGVEVDFEGSLTANWKLNGAFGYARTDDRGEPIVGAPEQTASLWTSYRFDGEMRGLTIGGGLQYVGKRLALADPNADGDRRDRVFVRSYTLLDLFARYRFADRWQLQANLHNLTDERYVAAALNNLSRNVYAGPPFEAILSLRYGFH